MKKTTKLLVIAGVYFLSSIFFFRYKYIIEGTLLFCIAIFSLKTRADIGSEKN